MESRLPLHVFISYAREDATFIECLKRDLEVAGIPIWIDTRALVPGTPDWEKTIRQAIEASFAVILVGSPAARDSRFVYSEFAVAQSKHIPVIPVWSSGTSWVDSAPLEATRIQYIDLREESYEFAISALISSLQTTIEKRRPRHCLLKDPFAGWYDHSQESPGFDGVPEYVSILLDRPPYDRPRKQRLRQERMAVFNPGAYDTLQAFLDDLYLHYLRERFAPLTYGREWVLLECSAATRRGGSAHDPLPGINPKRLILPWDWLRHCPAMEVTSFAPYWGRSPLDRYDLRPQTIWAVRELLEDDIPDLEDYPIFAERVYGIAVNNEALFQEIVAGPGKQPHPPHRAGFVEVVPFEQVDASQYRYVALVLDDWSGQPFAGRALRETDKTFEPNYESRWR